jgi:cytochrome c-type biogenesis protein CcmH
MTRRALPWMLLGVVVIGVLVWAAWPSGGSATRAERAHELATELRCPVCEALSVADSPSSTARAIRADIRSRIASGETDAQIRQAYIDRYGESILLEPEGSGLGVLVWGLPVVAVVLGAGGLFLALRRWQRQPRLHATDTDEALVARARETEPA